MSDKEDFEQVKRLLEEIRNNQRTQLDRQAESLSIQKEQVRVFLEQQEKTQKIQDRAEAIQDKSAQIVNRARRLFPLVLAAIVALLPDDPAQSWSAHRILHVRRSVHVLGDAARQQKDLARLKRLL